MIAAGVYSASKDGIGYQFIWSGYPELNNLLLSFSSFLVITLFLLLAYEFLKDTKPKKGYIQIGLGLLSIRAFYFILSFLTIEFPYVFLFDMFLRISVVIYTGYSLLREFNQLRYFFIAVNTVVIVYTIGEFTIGGYFPTTITTVYMHFIG